MAESRKAARESVAYVSVAVISALSDWIIFTAIVTVFPGAVLIAQAVARIVGGLVSFSINRTWSFRDQQGHGLTTEARRFLILYVFSYVLSLTTLWVGSSLLGVNPYVAKLFADGLCFVVNFLVMKSYVFSRVDGVLALFVSRPPTLKS